MIQPTDSSCPQNLRGALFIGGKSSRMGTPKSLIPKGGETLGVYLANLLKTTLYTEPVLLGHGPIGSPWDTHPQWADPPEIMGPLGGFVTLNRHFPDQWFLLLAVDLFYMEAGAIRWLLAQFWTGNQNAIWPKTEGRPFGEPMAAIYSPFAIGHMATAALSGERALHRALPVSYRCEPLIPKTLEPQFRNVNRPEDLPCSS